MDERLLAQLARRLQHEPVVVASVIETSGATPRKRGARMLITAGDIAFSIGGGLAEARTIDAARRLLGASAPATASLAIDLGGGAQAAGVCGGRMQLALRRWEGETDRMAAEHAAGELAQGRVAVLAAAYGDLPLLPNPRLLIVGAGHCGAALCEAARHLDFDIAVFDTRAECFTDGAFAGAAVYRGDYIQLTRALDTPRPVYAVLLNRDFAADIASLRVLCQRPPAFLGMMGSHRRIRQVLSALPEQAAVLARVQAPVGLEIAAETPQEIAISILAQLVRVRRNIGPAS
ncbi:MAG: XdhC family protein [Rhodanobacteraceae bacterium]|nr:XdhC family protein [Rhodanobacteraceae bacterium]